MMGSVRSVRISGLRTGNGVTFCTCPVTVLYFETSVRPAP